MTKTNHYKILGLKPELTSDKITHANTTNINESMSLKPGPFHQSNVKVISSR